MLPARARALPGTSASSESAIACSRPVTAVMPASRTASTSTSLPWADRRTGGLAVRNSAPSTSAATARPPDRLTALFELQRNSVSCDESRSISEEPHGHARQPPAPQPPYHPPP